MGKVKIIYNFLTVPNEPSRIVRNPFKLGSPYPMVPPAGIAAGAFCAKTRNQFSENQKREKIRPKEERQRIEEKLSRAAGAVGL